jgi:hypothetical protein
MGRPQILNDSWDRRIFNPERVKEEGKRTEVPRVIEF